MPTRREFLGTVVIAASATTLTAAPIAKKSAAKSKFQFIATTAAPKAAGPYSQAIRSGNDLYLSGQIPLDPATGNFVEGDFSTQTRRVLINLNAVLREGGADFHDVVKSTVYLTDANFPTLNTIYGEYFADHKPARSTVGVAALPRGAAIEIDLVARV